MSIYGHLRHADVPSPYLIQADWSPLSSLNRASRAALVQATPPPPPPLTHRLQILPQASPSASTVVRLITTIAPASTYKGGGEITGSARATSAGYLDSSGSRIHQCASSLPCSLTCAPPGAPARPPGYPRARASINVGLNRTAMTGKLADKIPLTMSSLINTIPDSLYPEEDIPTSMNIFTSTESINHYSQMNTGKKFASLFFACCFLRKLV